MNVFRTWLNRELRLPPSSGSQRHTERSDRPFAVINGVAVTKEELDQRVAKIKDISKQRRPEENHPCQAVKLIGYWATLSPEDDEPSWPDIRRAVRAGWRESDRERLLAYLRNGHWCAGYLGFSACRFGCSGTYSILGSREYTDGEWVWPEGLPHYLERHAVMLPEAFVASVSARGWQVPPDNQLPKSGEVKIDHLDWLEWAKGLPDVKEAASPPDPRAMERFCLVLQEPEDENAEQTERLERFDECIWYKVQKEFGRYVPSLGIEQYIEWISVEHRDTVVSLILDGLHRYGLADRVKLICSEPNPFDWHHNRDITVWPRSGPG